VGKLNSELSSAIFRLPNLSADLIPLPSSLLVEETVTRTIQYSYDALYRLKSAEYDDGNFFNYTYDSVGNRLSETTAFTNTIYTYDSANRLASVNGVPQTWDANGNLLSDGVNTYTYNHANRLTSWTNGTDVYAFAYNGLGDRLQQTVGGNTTNYTLDLNGGLTQVLADGTNTYLYGIGRIGEYSQPLLLDAWQYHLPDALSSVRQLADASGAVSYAQSYKPYGESLGAYGGQTSSYGFAGEWTDGTGLQYLRARYYNPSVGAFFQVDPYKGIDTDPRSFNPYQYAYSNPMLFRDPTGRFPQIIAGGVLAFVLGTIGGGFIGSLTYDWALAGDCGCDMLQWAINTNRNTYVSNMAWAGGILGTVGAIAAVAGGPVAIAVGGIFVAASTTDALRLAWQKWGHEKFTRCDILRFSVDTLGILAGAGLIRLGTKTFQGASTFTGFAALDEMYANSRSGIGLYVRELLGANALEFFRRIVDPNSIGPHPNPVVAAQGGLKGTMPGGVGEVYYRPQTGSGNPAIDTFNIPGYSIDWKYHFPPE
jgi:RHS repeat-associated protein